MPCPRWLSAQGEEEICQFISAAKGDSVDFSGARWCAVMRRCFREEGVAKRRAGQRTRNVTELQALELALSKAHPSAGAPLQHIAAIVGHALEPVVRSGKVVAC